MHVHAVVRAINQQYNTCVALRSTQSDSMNEWRLHLHTATIQESTASISDRVITLTSDLLTNASFGRLCHCTTILVCNINNRQGCSWSLHPNSTIRLDVNFRYHCGHLEGSVGNVYTIGYSISILYIRRLITPISSEALR